MGQERFEVIGERLVRRFQTRDPFEIAQGLGIVVYDDCEGFGDLMRHRPVSWRISCSLNSRKRFSRCDQSCMVIGIWRPAWYSA